MRSDSPTPASPAVSPPESDAEIYRGVLMVYDERGSALLISEERDPSALEQFLVEDGWTEWEARACARHMRKSHAR
jgi:hypothetical protein